MQRDQATDNALPIAPTAAEVAAINATNADYDRKVQPLLATCRATKLAAESPNQEGGQDAG